MWVRAVFAFLVCVFSFWYLIFGLCSATTLERGVSSAVTHENLPDFKEVYRIKIENRVNGAIEVSEDEGQSWKTVGRVLYPTNKINENGYSASKWMAEGRIVATSVNAIHVKSGSAEASRTIFSILPREMLQPPRKYRSYISPDSSIYTDIPAGKIIFGGGFSPFSGNMVMVSGTGEAVVPLGRDYVPKLGDTFYILVDRPVEFPKEIVFENRFGGRITISYFSGDERVIGQVLRPASGVGRFEGSKFADRGSGRFSDCSCAAWFGDDLYPKDDPVDGNRAG
jgi:hypothetical protein